MKPANIMVGEFGEVQIMDWGLAKVLADKGQGTGDEGTSNIQHPTSNAQRPTSEGEPREADTVPATHTPIPPHSHTSESVRSIRDEMDIILTEDGSVTGTPNYMPPEQAEGRIDAIDERSDVYSLGAILYEMLALRLAVHGKTVHEVLLKVSEGNIVPLDERAPERQIPRELSAITMKALATRPEDRYQSVKELSRDISLYLEGKAVSAKVDSLAEAAMKLVKRHKELFATAAVAVLILAVLSVHGISRVISERNAALDAKQEAESQAGVALLERKKAVTARDDAEGARSAALAAKDEAEEARRRAEESRKRAEEAREEVLKTAMLALEMATEKGTSGVTEKGTT